MPRAFVWKPQPPQPLKVGIHLDILADAEFRDIHRINERDIGFAMHCWVTWSRYLLACEEGVSRIDLAGNPVGVVTAREAEYCKLLLAKRPAYILPKPELVVEHGSV